MRCWGPTIKQIAISIILLDMLAALDDLRDLHIIPFPARRGGKQCVVERPRLVGNSIFAHDVLVRRIHVRLGRRGDFLYARNKRQDGGDLLFKPLHVFFIHCKTRKIGKSLYVDFLNVCHSISLANSCSLSTLIPSFRAVSNFEPGSAPATTKPVFFETDSTIF